MSLLADRGLEPAQRYTKSAENRRLSDLGMAKALGPIQTMIETVAPKTVVLEGTTKTGTK